MNNPIREPKILLPHGCDLNKWSVVACDQFTSDKEYWNKLSAFAGDSPSALRLILPECFLGDGDGRRRDILRYADEYLKSGIFKSVNSYVYVRRTFTDGTVRQGLIAELDLECYDYNPSVKAAVRATEGTVEERLPARVEIRNASKLELPHIMVLCDDPSDILFGAVRRNLGEKLYGFELNCGGGKIEGTAVVNPREVDAAAEALARDTERRTGEKLFALVGDGNHSLAAAKKCYLKAKAENSVNTELLRYALVEIVNIYDGGITFEPIHRALYNADPIKLQAELIGGGYKQKAEFTCGGKSYGYGIPSDPFAAVEFVQGVVERFVKNGAEADYIHGDGVIAELGRRADCIGIPMPPIKKDGFTQYVLKHGVLPKKTFSMGDAEQKRYYLEARLIAKV